MQTFLHVEKELRVLLLFPRQNYFCVQLEKNATHKSTATSISKSKLKTHTRPISINYEAFKTLFNEDVEATGVFSSYFNVNYEFKTSPETLITEQLKKSF